TTVVTSKEVGIGSTDSSSAKLVEKIQAADHRHCSPDSPYPRDAIGDLSQLRRNPKTSRRMGLVRADRLFLHIRRRDGRLYPRNGRDACGRIGLWAVVGNLARVRRIKRRRGAGFSRGAIR